MQIENGFFCSSVSYLEVLRTSFRIRIGDSKEKLVNYRVEAELTFMFMREDVRLVPMEKIRRVVKLTRTIYLHSLLSVLSQGSFPYLQPHPTEPFLRCLIDHSYRMCY